MGNQLDSGGENLDKEVVVREGRASYEANVLEDISALVGIFGRELIQVLSTEPECEMECMWIAGIIDAILIGLGNGNLKLHEVGDEFEGLIGFVIEGLALRIGEPNQELVDRVRYWSEQIVRMIRGQVKRYDEYTERMRKGRLPVLKIWGDFTQEFNYRLKVYRGLELKPRYKYFLPVECLAGLAGFSLEDLGRFLMGDCEPGEIKKFGEALRLGTGAGANFNTMDLSSDDPRFLVMEKVCEELCVSLEPENLEGERSFSLEELKAERKEIGKEVDIMSKEYLMEIQKDGFMRVEMANRLVAVMRGVMREHGFVGVTERDIARFLGMDDDYLNAVRAKQIPVPLYIIQRSVRLGARTEALVGDLFGVWEEEEFGFDLVLRAGSMFEIPYTEAAERFRMIQTGADANRILLDRIALEVRRVLSEKSGRRVTETEANEALGWHKAYFAQARDRGTEVPFELLIDALHLGADLGAMVGRLFEAGVNVEEEVERLLKLSESVLGAGDREVARALKAAQTDDKGDIRWDVAKVYWERMIEGVRGILRKNGEVDSVNAASRALGFGSSYFGNVVSTRKMVKVKPLKRAVEFGVPLRDIVGGLEF